MIPSLVPPRPRSGDCRIVDRAGSPEMGCSCRDAFSKNSAKPRVVLLRNPRTLATPASIPCPATSIRFRRCFLPAKEAVQAPRGALGWYFGIHYFELGPSRKQPAGIGTIRRE